MRFWLVGLALMLPATGHVQTQQHSLAGALTVVVHEGWIRHAPPMAPVRAGYARIENRGDTEVRIDAASSSAFGRIEIHEMHDVDGVMQMRRLPQLRLAPDASAQLEPGGLHLMLFDPQQPLELGALVTIHFQSGDKVVAEGQFVVSEGDDAHHGNDHSHHEHHHH